MPSAEMHPEPPLFSIVIPTHGRPEPLSCCLQSLVSLDYPPDRLETVVVVDGGGRDAVARAGTFEASLHLTVLPREHGGPAAARNTGARSARGQWLVFLDDDCEVQQDWLRTLEARCRERPRDLIGGQFLNGLPDNPYATASHAILDFVYTFFNTPSSRTPFVATGNLAVPAGAFRDLGGFDESMRMAAAEDRDLCDRWIARGLAITYAPEVRVRHCPTLTLRRFWNQHFRYGRGAYLFHRARARRQAGRVRPDPSFYGGLWRTAFTRATGSRLVALESLILLSQVAVATGFAWESFSRIPLPDRGQVSTG